LPSFIPGVLKEQKVSCEDHSCPGDVYHPDFQCLLRFISSQYYPAFLYFFCSCAGVAAVAGELAKDLRHQDAVEEAGCDFFPLVVETFGVWSPFAL